MKGASWAGEIGPSQIGPSPSHTDQADATSNNYCFGYCFGEYSSLDAATRTLSNNDTHPPSLSEIKKRPIQLVRAGDEPKNPATLFCPVIEGNSQY
jgi:hypothetical protein